MPLYRIVDPSTDDPIFALGDGNRFQRIQQPLDAFFSSEPAQYELSAPFVINDPVLLAPVTPSKIVCVGLNYRKHAAEMNKDVPEEPLLFMKPPTSIIGPGGVIERPDASQEVHHEGELAIVIGKTATSISADEAMDHIYGFTCANDVTARDIQRREKRYTRAKGYNTFCPIGPCVVSKKDFDPAAEMLTLTVNGGVKQKSVLNDFIFNIPTVVSFVSDIMTLFPGDLILTGTPHGVGPIVEGDVVKVAITGIGTLKNTVR